jgi:hypothetical protein
MVTRPHVGATPLHQRRRVGRLNTNPATERGAGLAVVFAKLSGLDNLTRNRRRPQAPHPGLDVDMNDPLISIRLQRGAEHPHRLGARATAELLAEVAHRIGGMPCIMGLLGEDERRLAPRAIRLAGGDRFPRRPLRAVPR